MRACLAPKRSRQYPAALPLEPRSLPAGAGMTLLRWQADWTSEPPGYRPSQGRPACAAHRSSSGNQIPSSREAGRAGVNREGWLRVVCMSGWLGDRHLGSYRSLPIGNRLLNLLVNRMFGTQFTDLRCGYSPICATDTTPSGLVTWARCRSTAREAGLRFRRCSITKELR